MLRQQVVVEPDIVQTSHKSQSNVVVSHLAEASHDRADFGAEENKVAARLEVDDVIHSGSGSLSAVCTIYRQFSDASVTFESNVVPRAVIDDDAGDSNKTFATAAVKAILHLYNLKVSKTKINDSLVFYLSVDYFQNAVINPSSSEHDASGLMDRTQFQREQQMAFNG